MSAETVLIIGEGTLTDDVCAQLADDCNIVRDDPLTNVRPGQAQLALILEDGWNAQFQQEAEHACRIAGIPTLRGFVSLGQGIIGPLSSPGTSGCSECADMRRLMADTHRLQLAALRQKVIDGGGPAHDVWATATALQQLATLLAWQVRTLLDGNADTLVGRLYVVNLRTLQASRHSFLPVPDCPVCGHVEDDSPQDAIPSLPPCPKIQPDSYRSRTLSSLGTHLVNDYLDHQTGLLNGKMYDLVSPFAATSVNLPLPQGDEPTAGRTHSYLESEWTAILEGLERYCGLMPRGKRTIVEGSFRALAAQALNPASVGLHAPHRYEAPDFPFAAYHPDRTLRWVWGYSFLRQEPILVPELLAYYSLGGGDGFVYETSNGCAVGGSLTEAILHGMLEIVERDAFLLTWYAQLPLSPVDPYTADDVELRWMVDRLRAVAGFDLYLFNATMEHQIPSLWAIAKNTQADGVHLICAAGAHLDPIRAAKGALHELAGMVLALGPRCEAHRAEAERMLEDPAEVRHMEHHSMLYALPEAEQRLHFLLHNQCPLQSFAAAFGKLEVRPSLTDELNHLLAVFRRLQLDVIVVDQSAPELRKHQLHCVKVLIPGMLPMTFGHHLTRLDGLSRVLRIPFELGYTAQPLTAAQLNPHPHPFP